MLSHAWNSTLSRSFDDWAETYEEVVVPMLARRGYGYSELAETVVEHVNDIATSDTEPFLCLELGIGTGMLGSAMRSVRPEWQLQGLDISAEMLHRAAATGAYTTLYHGTAERLPAGSGTVNLVVTAFMMHSVMRRKFALAEILRVLRPGGKLVLIDLYRTTPRVRLISGMIDNVLSALHEHGAPSRYVSVDEMCRALLHAGFRVTAKRLLDADEMVAKKKAGKRMHGLIVAAKER